MSKVQINRFKSSIHTYSLPEKFTFPFHYQPHPLCELAVTELQAYLSEQMDWQHDFGIDVTSDNAIGKMFGVLLVQDESGELGYLSGFSGKVAGQNHLLGFVPPVFDMLEEQGFFKRDLAVITQLGERIEQLESEPKLEQFQNRLNEEQLLFETAIKDHRLKMVEAKKIRKAQRVDGKQSLDESSFTQLNEQLNKQSIELKNKLRDLNSYWEQRLATVRAPLLELTYELDGLKEQRKSASIALQNKLFEQYQFLNSSGEQATLKDLFASTVQQIPPAGAGECAAPKLLQYAFSHDLKPLALAEFWWGASPKSEVRKHKQFYAACLGKCQPILTHMLAGMEVDDNPLLDNPAADKSIQIIYEDDVMVIINKPSGLLSVPGKDIEDSVYFRMKLAYPNADSPLIVHRLDMSTSGLMVIALTKKAHKQLQRQFIERTVSKRYIALLDGTLGDDEGVIVLPLRVDLDDRPRQLVCYEYGRAAETRWQVINREDGKTRVYFYPKTGRTHQLRVHSAHIKGLNTPIVGDDLYGNTADRLHLHAELLRLTHPDTHQEHTFQVDPEF